MKITRLLCAGVVCAALLPVCGCIHSETPVAISKSTYSTIQESEQQMLSPELKFLTLEIAQDIALQNNPSFRTKYFAIVAARAQYYSAYTYYLPTVSMNYSLGQNYTNVRDAKGARSMVTTSSPSMNLNLTVFDSFVREMNILGAKHNWKQTEAAELDARRQLVRDVAYAYNNVLLAQAQIRISQANMSFQRELLKETELKFAVGASPLSDVLNFKTKYNSAESDLYNAQFSYVVAKYSLAALMGLTEGDIPSTVRFSEMPSADGEMLSDIKTYLDAALANRPDLKAYREQYESAKYGYYSSIAAFGPTLTFNLGLGYTDTHTRNHRSNNSSRTDSYNVNYGLSANWDIFSGGRTYLAMRAAEANMVATEFTVAAAWINVIQEVRVAYDNYITSLKQVKLNQKNVEIVRKMRDLVNEEYKAGSAGITRLNEAQYDLVNAETALANAVINMHNAKAQLKAATDAN